MCPLDPPQQTPGFWQPHTAKEEESGDQFRDRVFLFQGSAVGGRCVPVATLPIAFRRKNQGNRSRHRRGSAQQQPTTEPIDSRFINSQAEAATHKKRRLRRPRRLKRNQTSKWTQEGGRVATNPPASLTEASAIRAGTTSDLPADWQPIEIESKQTEQHTQKRTT